MAGHALRYDGAWYHRTATGAWVLASAGLRAGQDVPARERRAVAEDLAVVLEDLWQLDEAGALPVHVRRRGRLAVDVPASREVIDREERRRPSRQAAEAEQVRRRALLDERRKARGGARGDVH